MCGDGYDRRGADCGALECCDDSLVENIYVLMDVTDVELIVSPRSVEKISAPLSFTALTHPNIRNNVNSFVFSYGDGSRLHASFDASTTHAYRKHGMYDMLTFIIVRLHHMLYIRCRLLLQM